MTNVKSRISHCFLKSLCCLVLFCAVLFCSSRRSKFLHLIYASSSRPPFIIRSCQVLLLFFWSVLTMKACLRCGRSSGRRQCLPASFCSPQLSSPWEEAPVLMCICMYVCMYVFVWNHILICVYVSVRRIERSTCFVSKCVCMYACIHVCMYMYVLVRNHAPLRMCASSMVRRT